MVDRMNWLFTVDDFLPDVETVLKVVKNSRFGNASYIGKDFTGVCDATLPVKPLMEEALGHKIAVSLGILRKGTTSLPLTHYIHADNYDARGVMVLYFNKPKYETGTAFWRHKELGLTRLAEDTSDKLFKRLDKDIKNPDLWEMTAYVPVEANRAVFFDSKMFHSRYPEHLPQQSEDDPRYSLVTSYYPLNEDGKVEEEWHYARTDA